ncbi:hypothetical protein H7I53_27030 [Mycolicibacterium pulveris]|uniref:DUF4386 domain-containing protein n=1 Tax=Mycolicibacterium pulveris TaxID=36813 RepID=A0A7I7UQX9_MYCPV|nr:hypothetical protein [Mycolicibacterium pulveris]MCV6983863.1 hypothetical protein [Mycolicibacterium pulveris]BBY83747.1 hypothetical protein MPUL_49050 [Mycolicibacterium pulveris]
MDQTTMTRAELDSVRARQLLTAWSGPVLVVLFFLGLVAFMDFVPPPSPTNSGQAIAAIYQDNLLSMRIGIVICSFSVALLAPWGASIAVRTRRTESRFPSFTYTQLGCIGTGLMVAVLCFLIWAVAAFRPDDLAPESTRMLHDIGWYLFLFDVSPFMVWMLAIGFAVLMNRSGERLFPRWAGYFCIWIALCESPAVLILFFKTGPFAYNGVVGFWLPTVAFFAWVLVMTWLVITEVNKDHAEAVARLETRPPELVH